MDAELSNGISLANSQDHKLLNSYIYDYLVKQSLSESASVFRKEACLATSTNEFNTHQDAPANETEGTMSANLDAVTQLKSDANATNSLANDDDEEVVEDDKKPFIPIDIEGGFLAEWWSIFWDMFAARQGRPSSENASNFIAHNQRLKTERSNGVANATSMQSGQTVNSVAQQAQMAQLRQAVANGGSPNSPSLENILPAGSDMVLNPSAQMNAKTREALMRQAMMNNGQRKSAYPPTPAEIQRLKTQQYLQQQQQQQQQQLQQQQQQAQGQGQAQQQPLHGGARDDNELGLHSSPSAPSPSKRQRLSPDGAYANTPGQPRAPAGGPGASGPQAQQAQQMLLQAGINPAGLSPQQLMAFQSQTPGMQQKQLSAYVQGLASQQQRAMHQAANGPNAQQAQMVGASPLLQNLEPAQGGAPQEGSHALQDYQMQLMLLEQQNKKRLLMARQEQERLQQPGDGNAPQAFATASPQARLPGSPPTSVPQEQRSTPKLANHHGPGSPGDPSAPHPMQGQMQSQIPRNASPAVNFNPGIAGGGAAAESQRQMIYQRMMQQQQQQQEGGAMPVMMGPQAQMAGRGMPQFPPGHPAYNNPQMMQQMIQNQDPRARMFQQQQMMQQQMQQNGQLPRGMTPQQQHQHAMAAQHAAQQAHHHQQQQQMQQHVQQQAQLQQQQQHQGQAAPAHQQMPPPQAPVQQQQMNRVQPPSPSLSNNQPPTPNQQHAKPPPRKVIPDKKKPMPKGKKNGQAATPTASEPPTPTTPATPHQGPYGGQHSAQIHTSNPTIQGMTNDGGANNFGSIESGETSSNFNIGDFGGVGSDMDLTMMQDFDFDSFLQDEPGGTSGMNFTAFSNEH